MNGSSEADWKWAMAIALRVGVALVVAGVLCAAVFAYVSAIEQPIAIIYTNDTYGALEACG